MLMKNSTRVILNTISAKELFPTVTLLLRNPSVSAAPDCGNGH